MRLSPRQDLWPVLKETIVNWDRHGATTQSAALAFFLLTSLAPILFLVIAVSGLFFGREAAQGRLQRELAYYVGAETAGAVQQIVAASARPSTGLLTAWIGGVTLLASATGALMQLQESLNAVWEVVPKPKFFLRRLLVKRLLCFGLILGAGMLMLLSLGASAGLTAFQKVLEARLEIGFSALLGWLDVLVSWLLMGILFAMIYRILPDVELSWREVAWGSTVTAGLFLIGKYAIGFYLRSSWTLSVYGTAGSLVAILFWIYYSSLIFLLGAELTRIWSRRYREKPAPAEPGAVRVRTLKVPVKPA